MHAPELNGYHRTDRALLRLLAADTRLAGAEIRLILFALSLEREPGDSVELGKIVASRAISGNPRTVERARERLIEAGYLVDSGKGKHGKRNFTIATTGLDDGRSVDRPSNSPAVAQTGSTAGVLTGPPDGLQTGRAAKILIMETRKQDTTQNGDETGTETPSRQKPKVTMTASGFTIPGDLRLAWTKAYPAIDIDRETAKAFAWCAANPSKAPKKNFPRFLNGWFGRAKPSRDPEEMLDQNAEYEMSPADVALVIQFEKDLAAGKVVHA